MANIIVTVTDSNGLESQIDFGGGRYSALMAESFKDTRRLFGWGVDQAEAYARALGAEYGRCLVGNAAVKFGKLSEDGKVNMREAMSIKGITVTPCLSIALALVKANELKSLGFKVDGTLVPVNDNVKEWIKSTLPVTV